MLLADELPVGVFPAGELALELAAPTGFVELTEVAEFESLDGATFAVPLAEAGAEAEEELELLASLQAASAASIGATRQPRSVRVRELMTLLSR